MKHYALLIIEILLLLCKRVARAESSQLDILVLTRKLQTTWVTIEDEVSDFEASFRQHRIA